MFPQEEKEWNACLIPAFGRTANALVFISIQTECQENPNFLYGKGMLKQVDQGQVSLP